MLVMRKVAARTALVLGLVVCTAVAAMARPDEPALVATGTRGMVVSAQPIASRVGVEVLKAGGNAVDAAVATALALAVVHPQAGNLGGGGFLLYYRSRDSLSTLIDFRETAPARAHRDLFLDARGEADTLRAREGHLAAGVPGSPAGLYLAWSKYGRQPWRSLVAPAIRLAQDGFAVNTDLAAAIEGELPLLRRFPASADLLAPKGKPLRAGQRLVQKALARTLRLVAQSGPLTFYEGAVAERIVEEMERGGGFIGREDLGRYRAMERQPLRGRYRDLQILVPPPPSSGGVTMLEILALLEYYDLGGTGPRSTYRVHLTAEAMARAFADRATFLGDPEFVRVPLVGLLAPQYIAGLQAGIAMERATPAGGVRPGDPWRHEPGGAAVPVGTAGWDTLRVPGADGRESDHTTHLSVVDAEGNVAALTTTLNGQFGCGVLVPETGVFLNNEMDDFVSKPGAPNMFGLVGGAANAIEPGKRMLSSMAPAIVFRNRRPWLVLGSAGGPRIITTVLNVVLDMRDHGLSLEAAMANPRFHHQWMPDAVSFESGGLGGDVQDRLRAMGHVLRERSPWSSAQAIEIAPDGTRRGVSDPRWHGGAAGY
jgi:gamma-glutamyltranspeptidase/glutathione hydrolase